ncbi:MAG: tail fiber domain-containing protein, partial [Candidatus Paceibacterota bacterium]
SRIPGIQSNSSLHFFTNNTNTPRISIDTAGNVGIGTTTPSAQLTTTGTMQFGALGSAGASLVTDADGNVTVSSDERLKDVQGSFTRGLSAIDGINPITYKWNSMSGLDTQGLYTGFSAQNIQANIPEAVGTDRRGYLTLSDRPILAAAVNAIKELDINLASTTARMAGIESSVSTLGALISNLVSSIAESITTKRITVGDPSNLAASGITILDRATGQPVCMYVENGVTKTASGACGSGTVSSPPSPSPAVSSSVSTAATGTFTVTGDNLFTSESGATASFTVVLDSKPLANVTLPVTISDASEGQLSTTLLTFTPNNWSVYQTITVTGLDDAAVDGDVSYTVTVGGSTSDDFNWNGVAPKVVRLVNYDNDSTDVPAVSATSSSYDAPVATTTVMATTTDIVVATSSPESAPLTNEVIATTTESSVDTMSTSTSAATTTDPVTQ